MTQNNEIEASVVEVEKPKRQELWIPIYLSRESAEAVLKEDPGAFDALIHVPAESEPSPAREVDAVGDALQMMVDCYAHHNRCHACAEKARAVLANLRREA